MKLDIAVLSGDGIGPEVTEQAIKALKAVAVEFDHTFLFHPAPVGAIAIDETGNPLPESTLEVCKTTDAILFGAIGHPKYDNDPSAKVRPEQGLLAIRKALGLFCNIRPVKTFDALLHQSPLKEERVKGRRRRQINGQRQERQGQGCRMGCCQEAAHVQHQGVHGMAKGDQDQG